MSTSPTLVADGMPTPAATAARPPALRIIWLILAVELLANLVLQLPAVADFQKFGFYDEGSWMRLDGIVAQGAVPTVDVGYSYGMTPLLLGRAWFFLFGRTPAAFIGFVTACNILAAWGIARILHATGATWRRLGAAVILLPLAIFPNNYSLMHPLETLLIIAALASQVRGRYGVALAWATVAVLTKPSMGYVLGLVLLVLGLWEIWRSGREGMASVPSGGENSRVMGGRIARVAGVVIPPVVTAVVVILLEACLVGMKPALANIIPLKAAKSYEQMNFGIFHAGRDFWLHAGGIWDVILYYVFTPATFWILASFTVWGLGLMALLRLVGLRRARPQDPLVATVALLHAAFVFCFYAWAGSWTYYSYLPVLGLLAGLRGRWARQYLPVLLVLAALGECQRIGDGLSRWLGTVRTGDSGGLWVYADVLQEARQARELAVEHQGLFLVNGTLSTLWPEAQTPPCWFLSPGVLTDGEIRTIEAQVGRANAIVLYTDYDQRQEAWNWPELAGQRAQFELLWEGKHFRVLKRRGT